jgi:hypothetical protein
MVERQTIRVPVRVQWHANGGFTRIEDLIGRWWEIPTGIIPPDQRRIGSRFVLVIHPYEPGDFASPEAIRRMLARIISVERIV